ncbi:hypothetical protein CUC08_Gglean005269 [Alternaria sp. MG1]|nr:hypothetical protein CUC08_Gglean005269 [Alternaria sp. MG1]
MVPRVRKLTSYTTASVRNDEGKLSGQYRHPNRSQKVEPTISFFHLGQLYGSLGESEGCGTSTICPVASCLSSPRSTSVEISRSIRPSSLKGAVPGTCSSL